MSNMALDALFITAAALVIFIATILGTNNAWISVVTGGMGGTLFGILVVLNQIRQILLDQKY